MGSHFDESKAEAVCNFFERYLILPESGKPFKLVQWQREMLRHVFGHVDEHGHRIIRTLYLNVPKKNGKSALASGIALYLLAADGERSAEVYSVAGDTAQAGIIFDASKKMAAANPHLAAAIEPYRYSLVHRRSMSSYKVLSSEARTKDGIKASGILFDELHLQPDRELWDTLRGSGLSREQPLTVVTTTAGNSRQNIAWEVHDYAIRVRDGKVDDPSFYPVIFAADENDDPHSPEVWLKANPCLGTTFSMTEYRRLYQEALNAGPARFNSWKRYHLNLWQNAVSAWLPLDKWDQCGKKIIDPAALKGRACYCGVDISSTTDLTAIAMLFPNDDGSFDVVTKHFLPRANVIEAELRDGVPYRAWHDQGYMEFTEGSAIDHTVIRRRIVELSKAYKFIDRSVACDEHNAWQLMTELAQHDLAAIAVKQNVTAISPAAQAFYKLVVDGKLNHGRNPLLDWQAQVVEIVETFDRQIKPHKGKGGDTKRIDGIMAIIDALSRAIVTATPKAPSVYEARGIITL